MINHPPSPAVWKQIVVDHNGHLLQSWPWGQLKQQFGWSAEWLQVGQAAAQILFKRLPLGLTVAYIPKGPMLNWGHPLEWRKFLEAAHTWPGKNGPSSEN
jgi:lipid II:glycine glycyltransferase (peptidoglycan interpeptide bridge formation enzyme)